VTAPVDVIAAVVGFGLVAVAGARLGAGSHLALAGLFPPQGRSDWPRGVQEADAPRFALEHISALRAPPPELPSIREIDPDEAARPMLEPLELHVHRLIPERRGGRVDPSGYLPACPDARTATSLR
jgi:hypothetical protein